MRCHPDQLVSLQLANAHGYNTRQRPGPCSVSRPPSDIPPGAAVAFTSAYFAEDKSASPNLVLVTASSHQRQACLYYHYFNSHCTYFIRLDFFHVMSLLLAQVRPANLYIHSLMLYDIHATRPRIHDRTGGTATSSRKRCCTFSFSFVSWKLKYSAVR